MKTESAAIVKSVCDFHRLPPEFLAGVLVVHPTTLEKVVKGHFDLPEVRLELEHQLERLGLRYGQK